MKRAFHAHKQYIPDFTGLTRGVAQYTINLTSRVEKTDYPTQEVMDMKQANLTGAIVAMAFYACAILVFALRLIGKPQAGFWVGIVELCLTAPLVWLLWRSPRAAAPPALLHTDRARARMARRGADF